MLEDYIPIFILIIIVSGLAFAILGISYLIGPKIKSRVKLMPYESGVDPLSKAHVRFSIRYFIIALLFIIFDIEIVFLYPWAVVFKNFLS